MESNSREQGILAAGFFNGRKPRRSRTLAVVDAVPPEELSDGVAVVRPLDAKLRNLRHYLTSMFCSTATRTSEASKFTAFSKSRSIF